MAAYLIVDTLLDNPQAYEEYKVRAKPIIERFGGVYLARGGAVTVREDDLWSPTRIVVVEFPDMATANCCLDSADYQAVLPISKNSARRTAIIVDGIG